MRENDISGDAGMMKKIAALGLTAALAFAPMVAFAPVVAHAEDAAPATPMVDTAAPGAEKPMKKMKSHMMKHHSMKKSHKMKKMDAPAADTVPAPDAPK
jgi:hypothetical protein